MENANLNYADDIIDENEELKSKEYLGTFRWKRNLKFPKLSDIPIDYCEISNWSEYLNRRINFDIEPFIVDALSYPMSIVYSLEFLRKNEKHFQYLTHSTLINVVIMGASNKVEERIALESNYFDEIYNYIIGINKNNPQVNLYLVGQEIKSECVYTSKCSEKLKYYFFKGNIADFLRQNAFDLNKSNTVVIGLNCGFGAGFLKLSSSWVKDLIILLKFNYYLVFTYTNDYEDLKGEMAIIKNKLFASVKYNIEDNPFKSMTIYKKESEHSMQSDLWSCGNYGMYIVNGFNKEKASYLTKLNEVKLREELSQELMKVGITPN